MKLTKQLLAGLLSLLLLLGFGAPAMAEEDPSYFLWAYVQQPPWRITVAYGEEIVLSVEIRVAEGVEARFWWTNADGDIVATGPELRLTPESPHYPRAAQPNECAETFFRYHIAFYRENDQGEMEAFYTRNGNSTRAHVSRAPRGIFEWVWRSALFVAGIPVALVAWPFVALIAPLFNPLVIICPPIAIVGSIIVGFALSFMVLYAFAFNPTACC